MKWVETVEDGWNVLVGADKEEIVAVISDFEPEGVKRNIFGSGGVNERITEILGAMNMTAE